MQPTSQLTHPRDNFDAIRLIAAVIVVYGHSFPLTGTVSPGILGNAVQTLAVKVFFVLSGYLVLGSWVADRSPVRYLWRRCLRIFPGLVACILLTMFVVGPALTDIPLAEYFRNPWFRWYAENIALHPSYALPGVFEHNVYPNAVNGSLWSLPVEFSMYLLAPLVLLWGRGQKVRLVTATVILCALSLRMVRIAPPTTPIVLYATSIVSALDAAPYFFLGACWRVIATRKAYDIQGALIAILLLAAIPEGKVPYEIGLYVVLPYAILSFCLAKPALFGWMGRWGDLSYGVYIYGFLIQQIVSHLFHTDGRPLLNFGLSIVPTLLLAAASWHWLEKRFLLLKPRRRRLPDLAQPDTATEPAQT
ncbi:acyltransferase [Paraburkholderia sp. JHI869]|uniref:acyltransferase family protein n=1 Tax=Paraburkholderia sp. JHI869 TaxID=3112959 RepID=UPI0031815982